MVWPKSGSITSSDTSIKSRIKAIEVAGISGRRADSANSHAATTTKAGFAASDAWMLTPISVIHRREPLTSGPIRSVATIKAMGVALSRQFVQRHVAPRTREEASAAAEGIRATIEGRLRDNETGARSRKPLADFVFSGKWGHVSPIVK